MEKTWIEVTNSSQRQKTTTLSMLKVESEKRRIIFQQKVLLSQKSEVDLMLALNKSLQKTRILIYIQFSKVGYLQFGVISALFI